MSIKKPVIAANWKMYKTPQEGRTFGRQLTTKALNLPEVNFILFPSSTGLFHIQEAIKDSAVALGGQNVHYPAEGAFTGEVSVPMLQACGCEWVLVGHSERRHIFHEPEGDRPRKIASALDAGLKVMLCVGEQLDEREDGLTREVLKAQLSNDLGGMDTFPRDDLVIAYEPVWAIGTGVVATPEEAGEAHAQVRAILEELFPDLQGNEVIILYGGSVKPANATELANVPGIDGFLVGGASLQVDDFVSIAQNALIELKEN
jgi:triosephosphate isomerase